LAEVAKIEELTLEARVIRNKKAIEKASSFNIVVEVDKDVRPESDWDPFRGKVPQYAITRGITLDTCKRWGLGYDKIGKRLVFPVRRRDGKLVGMQGRDVTGEAERRHHNYEGFKKEKYLLGAHLLEEGKPIVVVEGAVGAVKVYQALYPEACVVAPLGEGFSKWHADTIADCNPPCVYIFTDGDAAGRSIASKIEYQLHGRVPMRLMECPVEVDEKGKKMWDAGNLPEDHIKRLFKNAKPIIGQIKWTRPLPGLEKPPTPPSLEGSHLDNRGIRD
jgi:5S rRNA maturation endonuclease (ribonuclease M5)